MKSNIILQGNALEKLKKLEPESVNCVMTSPPYWALRDYGSGNESVWDGEETCEHDFEIVERQLHSGTLDVEKTVHHALKVGALKTDWKTKDGFCNKCGAWKGQFGLEPTFDLYIKHLCDIFDEVKRVLRKDGTCFVNMGDTYNAGGNYRGKELGDGSKEVYRRKDFEGCKNNPEEQGISAKSLCMIPQRFAIEMINRKWILRNEIIWHKRNCMPSSVKDRFTVDFEYLFFFVKNKKYWFEQQFEKVKQETINRYKYGWEGNTDRGYPSGPQNHMNTHFQNPEAIKKVIEQGRNKRAVWTINPTPFGENVCMICGYFDKPKSKTEKKGYFGGEDKSQRVCKGCGNELITSHFAVYPEELCETPIKAGCPEFVCVKCGMPKVLDVEYKSNWDERKKKFGATGGAMEKGSKQQIGSGWSHDLVTDRKIKGYKPTCKCNTDFTGGIVLDPFFGAGTTGLVALKQNKKFIGIELNKEYIKIANARIKPFLHQEKLK